MESVKKRPMTGAERTAKYEAKRKDDPEFKASVSAKNKVSISYATVYVFI